MGDWDIRIYEEVCERLGKDWRELSTGLSNELLKRCGDAEELIIDICDEFEERIKKDEED